MIAPVDLVIKEEDLACLVAHAGIATAFLVERVLVVTPVDDGFGGLKMTDTPARHPYLKDYDSLPGQAPDTWSERFDTSKWRLLAAYLDGERVGGAVVAEGRPQSPRAELSCEVATLWDLRVRPEYRGQGVGSSLFRATEQWARARGCRRLEVETQNINVPACKLYRRMGCQLGAVNRFAYPDLPTDVQLLWVKELQRRPAQ